MKTFYLHRGSSPLLISLPHNGTAIPEALRQRLSDAGLRVADTDWRVDQLYDFAHELGASILQPVYSRYLVDLNRPPDGGLLYPGQNETGLLPTLAFSGAALYRPGAEPSAEEAPARIANYWQPYHQALQAEIARIKQQHGRVRLWDGHSIRSRVPMFFDGQLPDLNLGTANGSSCAASLSARLSAVLQTQSTYRVAINGRFKGGYITRHYGCPAQSVDAVQMEIAQVNYLDEDSFEYLPECAAALQRVLRQLLLVFVADA